MQNNYFLFEKQVDDLKDIVVNNSIYEIFTFKKNELIFHFDKPEKFLHISLDVQFSYLLSSDVQNIKKPKYQFFDMLSGQTITNFQIVPFDKHLKFTTDSYLIQTVLYGKSPDVFVYDKQEKLLGSFKNRQPIPEFSQSAKHDFRTVSAATLESLISKEPEQQLQYFLKRHLHAFNKTFIQEVIYRSGLSGDTTLNDTTDLGQNLESIFKTIILEIEKGTSYLYFENELVKNITLFPTLHIEKHRGITKQEFDNLNHAWQRFVYLKTERAARDHLFTLCNNGVKRRIKFLERSLDSIKKSEDLQNRKEISELKGNLLLTFKSSIGHNKSKVILENIFSENHETIEIKLNPAKTIVENATRYFEKYKNITEKQEIIAIKKETLASELRNVSQLKTTIEQVNYTQLKKIHEQLILMKILQESDQGPKKIVTSPYSFKRLILDKEWDVYIGKSGLNNDQLTFEHANKWDIWLHAQGVPGSHVIIRIPKKDFHPPQKVIEQAAQIAASNSKAKFSGTVPVIYTEVRHVSRIRKALPGTVSVRNEKVIFVSPLRLDE